MLSFLFKLKSEDRSLEINPLELIEIGNGELRRHAILRFARWRLRDGFGMPNIWADTGIMNSEDVVLRIEPWRETCRRTAWKPVVEDGDGSPLA
jgi:hypothetical protein